MDGNGLAGWHVDGVEHLAVALLKPVGALLQTAAQRLTEYELPAVARQRGGDGAILHGGSGLVVRQRLRGGGRSGQQELRADIFGGVGFTFAGDAGQAVGIGQPADIAFRAASSFVAFGGERAHRAVAEDKGDRR